MQPQMSSYECRIHRADKRKQKTDRNQTFTFHYETKGPWRSGSESLTQALISWGHDWICGIRVTHSWPWSKPALGQPWRIQTRARTTVSGILLRLTAHWTYERWCFLAASNEAESGPLELKTRWNICKNVCRQANRTWQGMEQGGAACCYGRLSFSWNHKLHAKCGTTAHQRCRSFWVSVQIDW